MQTYEPMAGSTINEAAERMVQLAHESEESVEADFNGITLTVNPGDNPDTIVEFYQTESSRRHEEWKNSPEGKESERRAKKSRKQAEAARAEGVKSFSIANPDVWQEWVDANTDSYGNGAIRYAARWANLMEQRMSEGAELKDIASETSHEADAEGITGNMYGGAVSALSQAWEHGEELRRWHNLDTQLGDEGEKANEGGGVLNPALLNLG